MTSRVGEQFGDIAIRYEQRHPQEKSCCERVADVIGTIFKMFSQNEEDTSTSLRRAHIKEMFKEE